MNKITIYPSGTKARVHRDNFITGTLGVNPMGYLVDRILSMYVIGVQRKSGESLFCISYYPPGEDRGCVI